MKQKYYDLLGVNPGDSPEKIKKAFRKQARKYHPDINSEPGAEEKFKKINEAYDRITNPENYKNQDSGFSSSGFSSNFGGFSNFDPFDSLFGEFFRQPHRQTTKKKSVRFTVPIDSLERGETVEQTFTSKEKKTCSPCNGMGGTDAHQCSKCNGTGTVRLVFNQGSLMFHADQACNACGGNGVVFKNICQHCGGNGFVVAKKVFKVNISATEILDL